jgi:hypothetical protein
MDNLIVAKVKDSDNFVWVVKGAPSKFLDGEEYVAIKTFPEQKETKLIRKRSLAYHWK